MMNTTLSVSGMSCQGCADSLSRLFDKEPGISNSKVSFEDSAANITFDPAQVKNSRLTEIIEAAGFSAEGKIG